MSFSLSYDDILLVPKYSDIESREEVSVASVLAGYRTLDIPLISAPMDTITEDAMANAVDKAGGLGIIHRYNTIEKQIEIRKRAEHAACAIGATGDYLERATALFDEAGCGAFCIDVAHGHHILVKKAIEAMRKEFGSQIYLIAGNIATKEAYHDLSKWGSDAIRVGVGGGCLGAGSRILMANATYKNIEDVVPGDLVINMDGKPVSVRAVVCHGFRKVAKIKPATSEFFYATPDHEAFVSRFGSEELLSRGYIPVVRNNPPSWRAISPKRARYLYKYCAYMPEKIDYSLLNLDFVYDMSRYWGVKSRCIGELYPSYELGYIFGTFLGDGWANSKVRFAATRGYSQPGSNINWLFGLEEGHIAAKVKECLEKVDPALVGKVKIKYPNNKNAINVALNNKPWAEMFDTFGKKDEKHLPVELMCSDKNYLRGILDGLHDSDGHYASDGRISFYNTSRRLIELCSVITNMLYGYFPEAGERNPTVGGLNGTKLKNCKRSFLTRTLKRPEWRSYNGKQIVKYKSRKFGWVHIPVYDIEVDCPTHSFIANNMIVHNSVCTTRTNTGHGAPGLQSIIDCAYVRSPRTAKIIADGGIRNAGDAAKALALGADFVMVGSMLSGTDECPVKPVQTSDGMRVPFRGMASRSAQESWRGTSSAPEGISTTVPYRGSVVNILKDFIGNLKSGLSYSGARNLNELREKVTYVIQSNAGLTESGSHILNRN